MSIAFEHFCLMVLWMMPSAAELSVWIGVGGWGCPDSLSVVHSGTASLAFACIAPISASVAKATMLHMTLAAVCQDIE